MKKSSKILSAFLALVMAFALAVPAFAADAPHDVDPYTYASTWEKYGDRLVSDSKLTINGVIGTETRSDGDIIFDVVVGGGYTLNMSYPAGRDRYYNTYIDMALVNGEMLDDDPVAGKLQQSGGWFSTENPQSQYVLTCTEDMVSTSSTERLYHFWLDWGDSPVGAVYSDKSGNVNFWLRVHSASGTSSQPSTPSTPSTPSGSSTSTSVKPAPGVSVPLNDGSGEFAYTVKSGDTLGKIAAYYYGNVNVYKLIYERNKDILKSANSIYAGQTIILPSYAAVAKGVATTQPSTPSQPSTPTQPSNPSADVSVKPAPGVSVPLNDGSGEFAYTIKSGDTLSRIAAYYYGNANVYKLIYERNKDILKSANSIYAGQTIILPSYAAVAQGVAKI